MKTLVAAMLLFAAGCASAPPVQTAAPAPPPAPDWRARVTAARALEDGPAKHEAMLVLLREALPGREVRLSGSSDAEHVHPDDNQPAPIVNFDPRLQQKQSARQRSGGNTRSLADNFGYYFTVSNVAYVVIGPAALDPRSPVLTRLAAEHELFHAEAHVGDPRPLNDRELETWSTMFVRFFDEVHQFRQQWRPMLNYYERASDEERRKAIDRLAAYYSTAGAASRASFEQWLARRKSDASSSKLIADLEPAINF